MRKGLALLAFLFGFFWVSVSYADIMIAQRPTAFPAGVKVSRWGDGFTPNGKITLYDVNPNQEEKEFEVFADVDGHFEIEFTYESPDYDETIGQHYFYAIDEESGDRSYNFAYYEVTEGPVPTIGTSPLAGPAGSQFERWGDGFTPNGEADLYFYDPNGDEYHRMEVDLSSEGTFYFFETFETGMTPGVYSWKAIDEESGREDTVSFTITQQNSGGDNDGWVSVSLNSCCSVMNPPVNFDQEFSLQFSLKEIQGRTKNFEKVGVAIYDPQDNFVMFFHEFNDVSVTSLQTWNSGEVSNTIPSGRSPGEFKALIQGKFPDGDYFDFDTTGAGVNPVVFTVTPFIEQESRTANAGFPFRQTGGGFTPNGNVTIMVRYPDGNESPTEPYLADEQGRIDVTYTPDWNKPPGYYAWWAIDDATGVQTDELNYCVIPHRAFAQTFHYAICGQKSDPGRSSGGSRFGPAAPSGSVGRPDLRNQAKTGNFGRNSPVSMKILGPPSPATCGAGRGRRTASCPDRPGRSRCRAWSGGGLPGRT